ncbi:hypothetical protein GCM10010222_13390 [Streptomyces tanashiensis]|nr:hypothetical protein GCM10010222_13390 [Streptomyces tanashiensis]
MRIRIDTVELPGLTCRPGDPSGAAYRNVHVAVQRRDRPAELLDPQPRDAASATWTLECTAAVSWPESAGSAGWALDELGLNESTFRDGLRRRAGRHRAWRG